MSTLTGGNRVPVAARYIICTIKVAMKAQRQVRSSPNASLQLQGFCPSDFQEGLVCVRVVALVQQPSVGFFCFPGPRHEHTFSQCSVRSRANSLLPPRAEIKPNDFGIGEKIDSILVHGVQVPGLGTDSSRVEAGKLIPYANIASCDLLAREIQ